MKEGFLSNLAVGVKRYCWPVALIAIVIARAAISFAAEPDSPLAAYGGISYFLLLLLALVFVVRNGIKNTLDNRPFWLLLTIGYGLWALDQAIILYHQVVLGTDVPDSSIADPVLFLHIAVLMAAVATLPNFYVSGSKRYRVLANSLLLLAFWGFIYVYAVFPYQYLFSNSTTYALRFDILYLIENLVLVAAVGILSLRAQAPWKAIYLHLLGASVLYALSSAVANTAIDSGGYVNGKAYGVGLTAAVCWFVWIPLRARRSTIADVGAARFVTGEGSQTSVWAMVVVLMLAVPMVWELFQRDQTAAVRRFRLLVAILAIVCLASIAYIKEHFAKGELISQLALANDRLRLAVEAGKSVGWEWDLKSGKHTWFGALRDMLGLESDTFAGRTEDFYSYVYPQDRQSIKNAVDDSTQNKRPYAAEFRIVRRDGSVRWVTAAGKPYYASNGDPARLLGIAVDITERKLTEEALQESEDRVRLILDSTAEAIYGSDLEGRCTFCNPACLRALGYKSVDQLIGKDMHGLIHHSHADGTEFPAEECRILRATRTGEGIHVDSEVLWRANGTNFPAEYWCHPQWKGPEVVGAVVAFFDITQRQLAQAALASVSGKLIEAQEQERRRIARELHDDIGQRLAVLAIELSFLQQTQLKPSELPGSLAKLQKQTSEIAADIQSLSHGLHSSRLQYLGMAAALRGFCQEFSDQQNVEVDFEAHGLPSSLAPDISLCLFRVLQEALHNAAKHSGTRHFEVRSWGTPSDVHLTVIDSGSGFDTAAVKAGPGLGLISMEERLKLLKGALSVESRLHSGTKIHARVPVSSESNPAPAEA